MDTEVVRRVVPFVDLQRQHLQVAAGLSAAFDRVIARGGFTLGGEVENFEKMFAEYVGASDAVGVGSGTDALHFALRACGVGPGDEVVTVVNTFAATAEAITMCGARPIFVDIVESTCLMDLDLFEEAITPRTKAIVPVHLYGQPVDMDRVMGTARRHGVKVVEDACQAHGANAGNGAKAGTIGDAGCFSFYPSKNLGALGDGGMVVTDDPAIAQRIRLLRNHGEDAQRRHTELGWCSRLHGMQAAFLSAKLPMLDAWNDMRRDAGRLYDELFATVAGVSPVENSGTDHLYHLYVVQVDERDQVRSRLSDAGVQTGIHYAVPLHLNPAFASYGYTQGDFPVAERVARRILSLPVFPHIKEEEVRDVVAAVSEVMRDV